MTGFCLNKNGMCLPGEEVCCGMAHDEHLHPCNKSRLSVVFWCVGNCWCSFAKPSVALCNACRVTVLRVRECCLLAHKGRI